MTTVQFPNKQATTEAPCCAREAIFAIKLVHSLAFGVIQTAIVYLLYKGLRRQTDRNAAVAASIAIGESAIYAGNGFRCPLTDLAERLGSEHGAVTDIFLPRWLASNVARIYTPLLVLAIALHSRNLLAREKAPRGSHNPNA
jgi:hypothetical protein